MSVITSIHTLVGLGCSKYRSEQWVVSLQRNQAIVTVISVEMSGRVSGE